MRILVKCFLLSLMIALFSAKQVSASHIVGGDLTYKHIVNDSFEVTLVLYIDCYYGMAAAISEDSTAMVAVFTPGGSLVKAMLGHRSPPVRINSVSLDCVVPPEHACVDQYIYKYYTRLPFLQGGYVLAFQRCCRNKTILNIIDPASSGATFWCTVPDSVWSLGYNTSAVFKTLPPNYLCTNRYFTYDHSAIDADGDSLSYELYEPYLGADENISRPLPPSSPPYQPVSWVGGYGVQTMMQGNPELAIDPVTGVISVTPQLSGQYVVGIAVNEFRNGKLINTTRRDFQFNVFVCKLDVVSAFAKDIAACNDTVTFDNTSLGATHYFWNFGDTTSTEDTSTEFEPTYVYKHTGGYKVKLIASKGNCSDSLTVKVVIDRDLGKFADADSSICKGDSIMIRTNDSVNFHYQWSPDKYLNAINIYNPISKPPVSISYIVTRTSDLCINSDTVNITVNAPQPTFSPLFIEGCKTAALRLDSVSAYPVMLWEQNGRKTSQQALENMQFNYGELLRLKLVVSDLLCYDTLYKEATPVASDSIDNIPNVFTPNGDGVNDCYEIKNVTLSKDCSQLVVYNRWGRIVFNSDDDGPCWNGTSKGSALAAGSYFYILQHKGKDFHGTITLIR